MADPRESFRSSSSLGDSLRTQARVVGALLMREVLTRYGRHNIGFLWLFVEPMIFTLGITTLWTLTKAVHGSDLPIVAFALTGYSCVLLWRNMPGRLVGAIEPNLGLMHHRNVRVIDIYFSRLILEGAGATTSFMMLSLLFMAVGWMSPPEDLLEVFFGWGLLFWFGMALGIAVGSFSERSEVVEKLWHPMTYLIFPLSGAAYLVSAVPTAYQDFVLLLPMVHAVEIVREGYFGSRIEAIYDIPYLVTWCLSLSIIGLSNTRHISNRIVLE